MVSKMSKTILALLALCLHLTIIFKTNDAIASANSPTLIVPDDYPTIQEAINNANPGDTIFVRKRTYYENIVINKSITLVGEDRENTIIDGNSVGNVVSIKTSNVKINGFTIRNSDPSTGCGIFIERFGNSAISNNNIRNNGVGIQIMLSSNNRIYENIISMNYIGVQPIFSSGNAIYKNAIESNTFGIDIYSYSTSNFFYENIIKNNNWGISIAYYSNNNTFYHNNFINNMHNVYAEQTTNIWNYGDEGNYWDNYIEKDLNKDGIGDTPCTIAENNIDYYPLMGMFYTFTISLKENTYHVTIISNSTIINFAFKVAAESRARAILFNASTGGSAGFSRVTVPKTLMKSIHAVLINEEEVNATLLNVTDVENAYLYIEFPGDCSIKIAYSELLDLYYQLYADYTNLLDKIYSLNASNNMLTERFHTLNQTLYDLLENYNELRDELSILNESYSILLALNASNSVLAEKISTINETLYNLLKSYSELQKEMCDTSTLYQNQLQNFKGLIYIFAATTAIFFATTIYLSKKAHEKERSIIQS